MTAGRAVVTGGHRRVGLAIAHALARRGLDIHLTWRTKQADAAAAVDEIEALGVHAVAHRLELTDVDAVREFADRVWREADGIDVLVNSASVFPETPLEELDDATWDEVLATNLKAPFVLAQSLGLRMREAGRGCVVNLLDWATDRPYGGYAAYFASKAGLQGLTRAMAVELAPSVRVCGVAPGAVLLPEGTPDSERQGIVGATPLARTGSPEDVARAVAFLALDSPFTTGEILCVDGGRSLT